MRHLNDGCRQNLKLGMLLWAIQMMGVLPKSGLMTVSVRYSNDGWDQSLN